MAMLRRRAQQAIKPIRSIVLGKDGVGKSGTNAADCNHSGKRNEIKAFHTYSVVLFLHSLCVIGKCQ